MAEKDEEPNSTPPRESSISHGFHPPLEPRVLRRSLILSALASTCGNAFFSVVQATIFNFFLEDLNLRERLPYFMLLLYAIGRQRWREHSETAEKVQ